MDEKLVEFGNNLRAERNRRHLSQGALAELTGLQMQHISKIEQGCADIRLSTLISLLQALNLKFENLFDTELSR